MESATESGTKSKVVVRGWCGCMGAVTRYQQCRECGLTWVGKPGLFLFWLSLCETLRWAESRGTFSFVLYAPYEALSMVFRHVSNSCRKSSRNVQKLGFSSAGGMFRVTCEPENRDSGNDEHRILRLFDVLNHVVGFIFHECAWKHPLHRASEWLWNVLKSSEIPWILDRNFTFIYRQKFDQILHQTESTHKHNTVQNVYSQKYEK